jgi:hypothetical protein
LAFAVEDAHYLSASSGQVSYIVRCLFNVAALLWLALSVVRGAYTQSFCVLACALAKRQCQPEMMVSPQNNKAVTLLCLGFLLWGSKIRPQFVHSGSVSASRFLVWALVLVVGLEVLT